MLQRSLASHLLRVVKRAGAIAAVALFPAVCMAELTDRIVTVVGDDVVTASELALEEALQGLDRSPVPPLRGGDALDRLEELRILRALAGEIGVFQPEPRQVAARVEAVLARVGDDAARRAWLELRGLTEADLESLLRARMVAETYVHRNVGLSVLTRFPEAGPEQDAAYREAYDAWIAERRGEFSIRRIDPQGAP
jgi:hypothetical protein